MRRHTSCTKCRLAYPEGEIRKHPWCKNCVNAWARANRAKKGGQRFDRCARCGIAFETPRPHCYCTACLNAYSKEWREKNPEKAKAQAARKSERRRQETDRACSYCGDLLPVGTVGYECRRCGAARVREWRKQNLERAREGRLRRFRQNRQEVLDHYGGKCACCGEATYEFLALDHILGGGARERRNTPEGKTLWRWARQNGYPDTLRILCHNCNVALGSWGYCPHTAEGYPAIYSDSVAARRAALWKENPDPARDANRERIRRARRRVLEHYGGKCACCGEARHEFLALDHKEGGGSRHRRELPSSTNMWHWARRNDYPPIFRILCHKCNMAIGLYGRCPHGCLDNKD